MGYGPPLAQVRLTQGTGPSFQDPDLRIQRRRKSVRRRAPGLVIGDLASDYSAGVRDSDHRIARSPDELLAIFHEVPHSPEAYDAVVSTIAEWMRTVPSAAPIRTERIGGGAHDHEG
jgi:hypothetical protein